MIFDSETIERLAQEDKTMITIRESKKGGEGVNRVNTPDRGGHIETEIKTKTGITKDDDQKVIVVEQLSNNIYPPTSDAFTPFTHSPSSNNDLKKLLFNNPLISQSDLSIGGSYDPEIINNIDRFEGSDRWFCKNCKTRGDKWFMMKHPCSKNKLNGGSKHN